MPFLVSKTNDFRFNRRSGPGTDALYDTIAHRCPVEVIADDFMRFFVGKRQPAAFLIPVFPF